MKTRMNPLDIIESSKSLFGKHGFKKVTMTDIATAAQISRPTLYSLYADKESVFAACILSHIKEFKDDAAERTRSEKKARQQLRALFEIYILKPFSWYFESEAYDMMVNASLYAPREMAEYWTDFEDAIRKILDNSAKAQPKSKKDAAKVLVSFARDARSTAKNLRELERLIDTAIELALP